MCDVSGAVVPSVSAILDCACAMVVEYVRLFCLSGGWLGAVFMRVAVKMRRLGLSECTADNSLVSVVKPLSSTFTNIYKHLQLLVKSSLLQPDGHGATAVLSRVRFHDLV